MRPLIVLSIVACACLFVHPVRAAVIFEVIERGTPTDGVVTMTGFRAVTVRVISTDPLDPITRVHFGTPDNGVGRGIWGDLH